MASVFDLGCLGASIAPPMPPRSATIARVKPSLVAAIALLTTVLSLAAGYHDAVRDLLKEVLALQDGGDRAAAAAFITRWGGWDDNLHGRLAAAIRAQQPYRFRLFDYAALETRR